MFIIYITIFIINKICNNYLTRLVGISADTI